MEHETKAFALEVEELKSEDGIGTFTGWLSVFGNEDLGHDIVEPGAFTKTLSERKTPLPILWQHDPHQPIGVFSNVAEHKSGGPTGLGGLRVKGDLNLETQKGREAYALLKQGAMSGLSIGYGVVKDGYEGMTRRLKELKLHEGSVVTFPMNTVANVDGVKAAGSFPLADKDQAWDAGAAIKRVRAKVGADDAPNASYAKCFFQVDGDGKQFGDYHLPFCDVIDGSIKAVPRAIIAAAGAVDGARGASGFSGAKPAIAAYYSKMGMKPPWEKAADLTEVTAALTTAIEQAQAALDSIKEAAAPPADEVADVLAEMKSLLTGQPDRTTGDAGADTEVEREALTILQTLRADVARTLSEV